MENNIVPSTLKKRKRLPAPKWEETFICPRCKKEVSWECGATDSDNCDDCEWEINHEES